MVVESFEGDLALDTKMDVLMLNIRNMASELTKLSQVVRKLDIQSKVVEEDVVLMEQNHEVLRSQM